MTTPKQPPAPLVREHVVLTPRDERIPTVLPTYRHHYFKKTEEVGWDWEPLAEHAVCEVHLGGTMCPHGFVYATEVER